MAATATERTVSACNALHLSTIPKDWADQVWQSDFCEPQSLPEVLENDVAECAHFVEDLENFLAIAREWMNINRCAYSSSEGLWKVLTDNGFSHQTLIAVLHSFMGSCDQSSYFGPKLESCALAANVYIVLVQVPGSGAYKVFHPLLFQKALDVIRLWPQKESNKRKRGEAASGRRTRARHGQGSSDTQGDNEKDMADVSDEGHFDSDHGNQINSEQTKNSIKARLLSLLQDAVLLLSCYSLKDFEQALHHVIQLFVEITRLDPGAGISSAYDCHESQIYSVKSMTSLAYIGLNKLSSPFHGSEGANTCTVFKHLLANVLMVSQPSFVSNGAIVHDVLVIKDQAVDFICHLVSKESDDILNAVQVLIQHLCTKCPERAEYRNVVSKAAVSIMRTLPRNLYAKLMAWIGKYSKNAKVNYRIFALDLILLLLLEPDQRLMQEAEGSFDDNTKKLLSKNYLMDVVVARCSDRAPTVRAKALQYFSQCATSDNSLLVAIVKQMLHQPLLRPAEGTPSGNNQQDVHQTEIRSISSIIRKRNCDEKVGVRKAALQALQSVIMLNLDSLEREDVLMLHDRCMDPALSVRRQAMISLTSLLQERPSCTLVHSLWLDGVMPLVIDRETTAQEKCFQILEEVLLSNIVHHSRSTGQNHVLAWNLLDRIASPDGQEVRRYLHFAFQHWSKQNKLPGSLIKALMSHIDSEHNKAAWLLLAEIGSASNKLDHSFVIKCWNEYIQGAKDYDCETLCRLLQVIGSLASDLSSAVVNSLVGDLQCKLIKFDCSPGVIAATIATLCKLCKAFPCVAGTSDNWCADLLKATEEFLSSVMLQQDSMDEELVTRHLFTVGEVAQLAPSKTTERLFMFVESMLMSHDNKQDADPLQKLNLSPTVKAHAFVTLGKLCLQNEDLAKQCIAALARELETSPEPAIRNNVTVVMCDLCVRYTSLVDRYIPNIAACLKDSASLVRRQTLTLLTHLLQEDFVKWKGSLFYRFVTTLVDDDPEIRKFADFCLVHLLLSRHPGMLFQHFVECVFHFNSFEKHKVYNKFPQTEREKKLFSLKGDQNTSKRFTIYQFMLMHMSDEDRFHLTGKLCQEVLGSFTDGFIKLDRDSGAVLKDALSILSSKNIKLSSMRTKAAEDVADEGDMAAVAILQARNKFLTQVLKKNMVENIIPIIIELKHMLEKEHSPLLRDLMSCLKEVMKDYRTEVEDVLCADRQLANEIEFDLKRFEEQQKELEEQQKRRSTSHSSPQVVSSPHQLPRSSPAQLSVIITPQLRTAAPSPIHKDCNRPNVTALAQPLSQMKLNQQRSVASILNTKSWSAKALSSTITVPISPLQNKCQHLLSTAALINSARKAMEHAKAVAEKQKRRSNCHENGPQVDGTNSEGSLKHTPLSPVNLRTFQKSSEERAASTPEGERSHLSRISFCTNVSIVAPPSPIPSSLPIRVLPRGKDTQPSWIERTTKGEVGEDDENKEIICLMSPEQKLPKPRTWNIKSPDPKKQISSKKPKSNVQNDSVSRRTRSHRK